MARQGKKHMGGRRRYVKGLKLDAEDKADMKAGTYSPKEEAAEQLNVPASRSNITMKTPVAKKKTVNKPATLTKTVTKMGDQPTRAMLGIKPVAVVATKAKGKMNAGLAAFLAKKRGK